MTELAANSLDFVDFTEIIFESKRLRGWCWGKNKGEIVSSQYIE